MKTKTSEKTSKLDAEFWPRFAKYQPRLIRMIQTKSISLDDAPLVVTMALHMVGEITAWETRQIEQLPLPHENIDL
jgi:hypothetical protein